MSHLHIPTRPFRAHDKSDLPSGCTLPPCRCTELNRSPRLIPASVLVRQHLRLRDQWCERCCCVRSREDRHRSDTDNNKEEAAMMERRGGGAAAAARGLLASAVVAALVVLARPALGAEAETFQECVDEAFAGYNACLM